ncbi:response regulator [Sandaracinus amylolyticus]|uniref:GGDEF domain-containing response regulator n=1 Tax=Sandaracinus amylolyticus TaxID=927083 RepID=UPI001F01BF0C|nr:response regulator [Sandaracinus amylolyticus]UJR82024.1 Phosphate regulon transcriptional regulatory protein PhoB [Sandaracinus amylolyticus]
MNALVLIAEPDPFNLRLLQEVCEAAGHEVVTALEGGAALDLVARKRPDLALIDVGLPMHVPAPVALPKGDEPLGGLEVLRVLKADPELKAIPVLVTTPADDVESRRASIVLGAEDYVARPYRVFEIQQRIRNALRRVIAERRLLSLGDEELLDPLTRAGSAAQMQISIEYEMTRAVRYGHPLSCVSLRVAGLGRVIAELGREAGDGVLVQLTQGVRGCIRAIDHLFRADRDELVVLLPETSAGDAKTVVRRLREREESGGLAGAAIGAPLGLEIGLAGRPESRATDGPALLAAARSTRRPLAKS